MSGTAETEDSEKKKGWTLPDWVRVLAMRVLWVLLPMLIVASIKMYWDVLELKKDVIRNTWWNEKQDEEQNKRHERTEERVSRLEGRQDNSEENDADFHSEMREKMNLILKMYRR